MCVSLSGDFFQHSPLYFDISIMSICRAEKRFREKKVCRSITPVMTDGFFLFLWPFVRFTIEMALEVTMRNGGEAEGVKEK